MYERWAVLDFETLSQADLKKVGSYRYAEDPTTEVLCLSYCLNDSRIDTWFPGQPIPEPLLRILNDPAVALVAHNAAFERAIFQHVMPRHGVSAPTLTRWHCSLARCAQLVLPMALERALKALNLSEEKDMEGNRLVIGWNREYAKTGMRPTISAADLMRCGTYCESDVRNQRALHKRIGWLPEEERTVWMMNQDINDRGVGLDMELVGRMQRIVAVASKPLAEEFKRITGLDFTQVQKLKAWVIANGVEVENLRKETLAELLGDNEEDDEPESLAVSEEEEWEKHQPLPPHVDRALRIRQLIGSASIKKLGSMQGVVGHDGRARGLLQYHGTGPGRETARLLQPHNFPRGTIKGSVEAKVDALLTGDAEYVSMVFGPPVETVVSSLRHTLKASAGRIYLAGDYAGIQARTVLGLAGQADKTELLAKGADAYIDMAMQIYPHLPRIDLFDKAAVHEFKELFAAERQDGKNSVLGLGFQMGGVTFQTKYAKDRPMEFCNGVVATYRRDWAPKVPLVWEAFQHACLDVVRDGRPRERYGCAIDRWDQWLRIRLPSGRYMHYYNPRVILKRMPWSTPEEPDIREAWCYQATKSGKWITVDAFGGKTTENVVMGIERDLMTDAMEKLEANGFPICLEVHDEIVAEPLLVDADELAFKQIMEDVPQWARSIGIPVSVETWASERYKK